MWPFIFKNIQIERCLFVFDQGSLKTTHHNTQNISNAQQQHQQQQSALSIVEIAPLNVGSYSNGNTNDARADADDGLKTIETSQNSTSDEEASHNHEINLESEIQKNNGTNDIITIPTKLALNKHNNDATTTTEKLQLKAEKIVDNYAVVVAEPHESNNAIGDNIFSDVDTNFIDVGHQAPRNSSSSRFQFQQLTISFEFQPDFSDFFNQCRNSSTDKTSEKNNTENHGDVENRHPLHLSEYFNSLGFFFESNDDNFALTFRHRSISLRIRISSRANNPFSDRSSSPLCGSERFKIGPNTAWFTTFHMPSVLWPRNRQNVGSRSIGNTWNGYSRKRGRRWVEHII